MLNSRVAKVGASYFEEGDPIVGEIQRLIPEFQVKHVVACRGTNRIRPPQIGWSPRDIPWRKTVVVQRDGTGIAEDGEVQEWGKLPRYKQYRKGIPARLSMTAYGEKLEALL